MCVSSAIAGFISLADFSQCECDLISTSHHNDDDAVINTAA